MSVILLTTGTKRDIDLRDAITAKGWQIDEERPAFGDPEVCRWGLQDPPCVVKLHDGRAVYECSDPAAVKGWTYHKGLMTTAVNAYEAAKAEAQAGG